MKNVILTIVLLLIFILPNVVAQHLNKECDYTNLLAENEKNHIEVEFLNTLFNYPPPLLLGCSFSKYEKLKTTSKLDKKGDIKIKNHPFFTSVEFGKSNNLINYVQLDFKPEKYNLIKSILDENFGDPDEESYGHLGHSIYFVPDKYIITLSKSVNDYTRYWLRVQAIDYVVNRNKYDEFSKVGMSFFDKNPINRMDDDSYTTMDFIYTFDRKNNYSGLAIRLHYTGDDWFFIKKVHFLLSNGEVLTFDIEPTRTVEKLVTTRCKEHGVISIDIESFTKIFNSETIKVKISGESTYTTFNISKLHKYQMKVAQFYYENKMLL